MKKIKLLMLFAAFIVLPLIYFTGCSDKSEVTSPNQVYFDSPTMAIIDFNDAQNGIEDATLETGMTLSPSLFSYSFINDKNFTPGNVPMMGMVAGNMWMGRFDWGKHLGFILRRLNLTDTQKGQVKDAVTAFHAAMKPLVKEFHDANAVIIKAANEARKAILDQVKAGTLSRADAKKQLDELNKATRDKIANNSASLEVKKKMCTERDNLFNAIVLILTPNADQLKKWNDAVAKFPNPCK